MEYDSNAVEIGKRIQECRRKTGKTLIDTANELGISPSALSMYESGERIPRDNIKIRISKHFNVPIQVLFFAKEKHEM